MTREARGVSTAVGPVPGRALRSSPCRALTFPIRLRCASPSDLLTSADLEDAASRALGRAFARARRVLPAEAVTGGGVVLNPPELVKGSLPPDVQATLLGRLGRAIERAAQTQALPFRAAFQVGPPAVAPPPARPFVLAKYTAPAKPASPGAPWRVRIKVDFHITPRQFFEIRRKLPSRRPKDLDPVDLLELYYPLLDKPMPATAWVVEVLREHELTALSDEVARHFAATRPVSEIVWGMYGWIQLRAMIAQADRDQQVAGRVPEFGSGGFLESRPGPKEGEKQSFLRPGAWVLNVFLPLPNMQLGDLVELKPLQLADVPLGEAGVLFTSDAFRDEVGLDWATAQREAPDLEVRVGATAFTVRRKVHERTLAALFTQYRRATFNGARLGRVVPFTGPALQELGPTLGPFLRAFAATDLSKQRGPVDGFWLPGAAGADLTPMLEDVGDQVLRKANAPLIAAEADEAQRILGLKNTIWNADRDQALARFINHWSGLNKPRLFGFLLDELQKRGALDEFLSAVRGLSSLDTYLKRVVVALAAGTGYVTDPRVLAVAQDIKALERGTWKCRYDVDAQEVWIDGDPNKKVRAADGSGDDKVGVVAEVEPYYSESSRIPQPKPEILERLREPTRKKVQELIGRMVCNPGEQMTQEELLQKATQEAAKELPPLQEEDLVKVTLRKSIRVLKLERRVEGGVEEIYVHYQPVQKVGDNPWMPAGEVIIQAPYGFEAYLTYYHVKHELAALSLFFLAETVVFGGVMIVELGVATLGQLLFFITVQEALYVFSNRHDLEELTLEGFLTTALKGEVDAVGFKLLSGAAAGAGKFVVGEEVTQELVKRTATKWIVFGLRGVVMGAGVGAMEVTYQFAEDLVHYSHCQGWSSPGTYWRRFGYGAVITLAFEFVAIPILAPPARLALEKAPNAWEAARALFRSGKSKRELTEAILEGSEKVEESIRRTISHGAGPDIAKGYRERVADVLKALRREYESRAYSALLDLYGPELSGDAAEGLRRLLKTATEKQIDAALQRLLAEKTPPTGFLRALAKVDEKLLADLVGAGQLTELGLSRRVTALLTQDPEMGARLLRGPFNSKPAGLERFLGRLEPLPPDVRESVLKALARDRPLPPERLLAAAKEIGVLDEPALKLLQELEDAKVRFSGRPREELDRFTEKWLKRWDRAVKKRAAALEDTAGGTPDQVPEQATAEPEPAEPRPSASTGRTLDEIKRELQGKGITDADLRQFLGKGKKLSAQLAARVARLAEHFTPEEVKAFGKFLASHKVALNDRTVEKLLNMVPRGKLEAMIRDLEAMSAGDEPAGAEWSEEQLADWEDKTIHPGEPPPVSEFVETPGSQALRSSLIARDGEEPPPGYHAHHVVPEKEFGAGLDWMRKRLENAGCGINDADNGVFLAGSKSTANPELTRLHNSYIHAGTQKEYAYTLTRRLADKHGAEFLTEVKKIAKEMAEGEFKTLEIPHGWKGKWEPGMTAPIDPTVEPKAIEE